MKANSAKNQRLTLLSVLLFMAAIAFTACSHTPGGVFLSNIYGQVQVLSVGSGEFQQAQDGQKLMNGDEVLSNADGGVDIHLANGTILRLNPFTHIILHSLGETTTGEITELSIKTGSLLLSLDNNRASVNTPGGKIELQGGELSVSVDHQSQEVAVVCFQGNCRMQTGEIVRELTPGDYHVLAIGEDQPAAVSQPGASGQPPTLPSFSEDSTEVVSNDGDRIILTATEVAAQTNMITLASTAVSPSPTMTQTFTQVPAETATMQPSNIPTQITPPIPTSSPVPGNTIYWNIDFETGDFSQLDSIGELISQANGSHTIVSNVKHSGSYSSLLEIEEQGTDAAYLFFYKAAPNEPLPGSFYLSAWVRLGAGTCSSDWWNTFQFKSSSDGNSSNSDPVHSLNIRNHEVGNCSSPLEYQLFSKAPAPVDIHYQASPKPIPVDQWFHIEVYYQRDPVCGQMKVWQDGAKIFDLDCVPTVYPNDTLYPSINNYSDGLSNLYYLDDIVLANYRVGP